MSNWCAIDFGTSNSAVARPGGSLVALENGERTMPTAVFYPLDEDGGGTPPPRYGRAAVAAYVEGFDGRLMRSMKSILGSDLVDQPTDLGGGRHLKHVDVIAGYLKHLKSLAEAETGAPIARAVLGRPVFFVDGDERRDRAAQAALERAARSVGFDEIAFQFEPIAAALDYERGATGEQRVLVADIGGGTSDFSLVRVGPQRRGRADRRDDILANHGVHIAGTDFDRHVELAAVLPPAGYRGVGPQGREVPSRIYHDLATWHLINTVYLPARVAELRRMRDFYADAKQHARLMRILEGRHGHALAARAEGAKIALADGGSTRIDLSALEAGLHAQFDAAQALHALNADMTHIAEAALATLRLAGLRRDDVDVLYFTGGSTGFTPLAERIGALFPRAQRVRGDRFASVAMGLGEHAARLFSPHAGA